jgi:hypothetical protein
MALGRLTVRREIGRFSGIAFPFLLLTQVSAIDVGARFDTRTENLAQSGLVEACEASGPEPTFGQPRVMPTCRQAARHSARKFWHSTDSRSSHLFVSSTGLWVASVGRAVDAVATGLPYVLPSDG